VSPVKYELGFNIPEDGILHNHRCENLKSYLTMINAIISIRNMKSNEHYVYVLTLCYCI
jgi:hypothetical protein